VWFNGELLGPSQGKLSLRAGLYLVRFYRPGYVPYLRWIRVHPNRSRKLSTNLVKNELPEPELVKQLRAEAGAQQPGPTISQVALEQGAAEVYLVNSPASCTGMPCPVSLHHARNDEWKRREKTVYRGKSALAAARMLGIKPPEQKQKQKRAPPAAISSIVAPSEGTCTMDSQCLMNQTCEEGRCVSPTPLTEKWWFWTLIGVGVAGATTAIVVPLTLPEGPVIDVR
jgi:hypothetical protein